MQDLPHHAGSVGHLDLVDRERVEGWAYDPQAPDDPISLRIINNGHVIGMVVANLFREDLAALGTGGRHSFRFSIAGGLSAHQRHVIRVQRATDGTDLPNSPVVIEPIAAAVAAPITIAAPERDGSYRGNLDRATRDEIAGWICDENDLDTPVALQVLDNGQVIGRVLANRHRADLAAAGIGAGRYSFDLRIPGGLSPLTRHVIQVIVETTGVEIPGSPQVVEASRRFEPELQHAFAAALAGLQDRSELDQALGFLTAQTEQLLQHRADVDGQRTERLAYEQFRRRWGPAAGQIATVKDPGRRALVIDEWVPSLRRDAGSNAILSHIRALQRLGYDVSFAAFAELASPELPPGVGTFTLCSAPFYGSVEDILRRQAGCFDVVYLHRVKTATRYLELVRAYNPRARILFSVADLHHIRVQRQAIIEQRPELTPRSQGIRMAEHVAAWSADAVITHSAAEGRMLREALPQSKVCVVPWDVPSHPTAVPFVARAGLAFIGGYAHSPNVDAAHFLAKTVMPLVRQINPAIECLLVGSAMPDSVRALAGPGLVALGQVDDLAADVFDRVRLTVAPLRYGAGVKGKVLDSLAAGVPCVMTPVAAEGLPLPNPLAALVGADAPTLAALICRLHDDETINHEAREAGLRMMAEGFTPEAVTASLRIAIDGDGPSL